MENNAKYKLGVGAIIDDSGTPVFFIEYVTQLCPDKICFNAQYLMELAKIIGKLENCGYKLNCDGGTATCEKRMAQEELESEYKKIMQIIEDSEEMTQ